MCKTKIIPMILPKTTIIENAVPEEDMLRKMPKIYSGKNGTMTLEITSLTIFLKSFRASFRVSPLHNAIPIPKMNAKTNAVITSKTGSISIVKNGFNSDDSGFSTVVSVKSGSIR